MERLNVTMMDYFNEMNTTMGTTFDFITMTATDIIKSDTKTMQNICPRFEARTPYLMVLISSTISIWLSALIVFIRMHSSDHKYEAPSIQMTERRSQGTITSSEAGSMSKNVYY